MRIMAWLRGLDLNQRPPGYEPDELPGCSTPRIHITQLAALLQPRLHQARHESGANRKRCSKFRARFLADFQIARHKWRHANLQRSLKVTNKKRAHPSRSHNLNALFDQSRHEPAPKRVTPSAKLCVALELELTRL